MNPTYVLYIALRPSDSRSVQFQHVCGGFERQWELNRTCPIAPNHSPIIVGIFNTLDLEGSKGKENKCFSFNITCNMRYSYICIYQSSYNVTRLNQSSQRPLNDFLLSRFFPVFFRLYSSVSMQPNEYSSPGPNTASQQREKTRLHRFLQIIQNLT